MPLLKGSAGKATPRKALAYITRKDKAKFVDVQNLFEDEDYAEQFRQTAARFGKYMNYDERKYYHFKLSPDRADHADPRMVQEYAKACAEKMFEGCECVIATHTDTQTVSGRRQRTTEHRTSGISFSKAVLHGKKNSERSSKRVKCWLPVRKSLFLTSRTTG